jgi:uracil-DNA glycosylase
MRRGYAARTARPSRGTGGSQGERQTRRRVEEIDPLSLEMLTSSPLLSRMIHGVSTEWLRGDFPDNLRIAMESVLTLEAVHPPCDAPEPLVNPAVSLCSGMTASYPHVSLNGADHLEGIIPSPDLILDSLRRITPSEVRVIIVGQDPYPNPNHACGVPFQTPTGEPTFSSRKITESLLRYHHIPEREEEYEARYESWIRQGVLMLNASLTTRPRVSDAHSLTWKTSNAVGSLISLTPSDAVVLLLGSGALSVQASLLNRVELFNQHPRSPQFLGVDSFGAINAKLREKGKAEIDWTPGE